MAVHDLRPGELIAEIAADVSTLVRKEIALAKQEVGEMLKAKLVGAALFAVAGVLGILLVPFILLSLIYVLAIWMPIWAAALSVTGFIIVLAVGAGAFAIRQIKGKLTPERTIRTLKGDLRWMKRQKS
ncbi:MAG: phage holin family protein [Actinomycetota bacterium]